MSGDINLKLIESVKGYSVEDIEKALCEGADINFVDTDGWTALHWAVDKGNVFIADFLLSKGADPNKFGEKADPVIFGAAILGYLECMQLLVEHGANVSLRNSKGETAFVKTTDTSRFTECIESMENQLECAQLLMDHGVDINTQNDDGLSILYKPLFYGKIQVIQFFLDKGADPLLMTPDGVTVLEKARNPRNGHVYEFMAAMENDKLLQCIDKNQTEVYDLRF